MSRWIGLTGKMAAGKDYAFRAMRGMGARVVRQSFADQLRYEIEDTLGVSEVPRLWAKPYPEEIRRLLQWWGTDFRRAEDPDYWVKKAEYDGIVNSVAGSTPVFTDVRFPNEADMIRKNNGIIVRVFANIPVREQRIGGRVPEHVSEHAMDEYEVDFTLLSDEDNEKYEDAIIELLEYAGVRMR